jgi:hypothetical protein
MRCGAQGLSGYSKELAVGLLSAMYEDDADFTNTFRALGGVSSQPADGDADGVPASLLKVRPALHPPSCSSVSISACVHDLRPAAHNSYTHTCVTAASSCFTCSKLWVAVATLQVRVMSATTQLLSAAQHAACSLSTQSGA